MNKHLPLNQHSFHEKGQSTLNYGQVLNELNRRLYGLTQEKEQLLTYLKIVELNKYNQDKFLCLIGPKGVGKKSLIYHLAQLLGRKLVHIKIGLSNADAGLPTYGKTKIGEIAGQIIHVMNENRGEYLIIFLEGIEYIIQTFQNRTNYDLKEVLAISHDHALRMNHISEPLDFRKVLFIGTAKELSMVSQDILSQFEIIYCNGYIDEYKIRITRDWIVPRVSKACGIAGKFSMSDDLIYQIIHRYTNEIGVSRLDEIINKLCKSLVFDLAISNRDTEQLNTEDLHRYLGHPLYEIRMARTEDEIGVISTIGRSNGRGVVADLEVLLIREKSPRIIFTGNMHATFQEIIMVGISYLLSNASRFDIENNFNEDRTIHINIMPAGILKSGVSAGLSVVLALISALTQKALSCKLSAIGEITLYGRAKKVIGLHEKLLGASRLGFSKIIVPKENMAEINRLPAEVYEDIELIPVETIEEAFGHAFPAR